MSIQKKVRFEAIIHPEDGRRLDEWLKAWNPLSGTRDNLSRMEIIETDYTPEIDCHLDYGIPLEAKHVGWEVFFDDHLRERCVLVMIFRCPELENRRKELARLHRTACWLGNGADPFVATLTWAQPSFLKNNPLPILPFPIRLVGESIDVWNEPASLLSRLKCLVSGRCFCFLWMAGLAGSLIFLGATGRLFQRF